MRKELIWAVFAVMLLAAIPVKATPDPGLVGLWHFDTVNATTDPHTTPDSSGQGNTGYLYPIGSEPTLDTGKFYNALRFDGSNDYVNVGNIGATGDWTIEFWAILDTVAPTIQYPIGMSTRSSPNYGSGIFMAYSGSIPTDKWGLYDGHQQWWLPAHAVYGSPVSAGVWYHVAVTKSGTTYTLYLNGAYDGSSSTLDDIDITNLQIGRRLDPGGGFGYLHGVIDEVRIWNQALTANQVAASYSLRLGTEIGQEDLNGDGYPDVIFTSAFYLGRQVTGYPATVTITILPVNPSVVVGYDIDGDGGVEPDEYVVKVRVTPKGTDATVSTGTLSPSGYSVTVTVIQGDPPCNSVHLWLYLSTGDHVGVNVQFLPYG